MNRWNLPVPLFIVIALFVPQAMAEVKPIVVRVASPLQAQTDVILDTRPLSSCRAATLAGTVCLPIEDILAPQRRLANWSGLLWLLGTAGLTGREKVLVIGETSDRRDFLAGILVLAGQRHVSVADTPVSEFLSDKANVETGKLRHTTRVNVFTEPMRSELIALRNDVASAIQNNAVVLDGRTESEYYGTTIRNSRGGHIPGAIHSPLTAWNREGFKSPLHSIDPLVYSHDVFEGVVYFSTLLAAGLTPTLYLNGWVDWASDGSLPVDNASYPMHRSRGSQSIQKSETLKAQSGIFKIDGTLLLVGGFILLLFSVLGFIAGKHLTLKRV